MECETNGLILKLWPKNILCGERQKLRSNVLLFIPIFKALKLVQFQWEAESEISYPAPEISLCREDSLRGDPRGQIEADNLINEDGSRTSWHLNQPFFWKQRHCTISFLIHLFLNTSWSYLATEITLWPLWQLLLFAAICFCYSPCFHGGEKKKTAALHSST